MRRLAIAVAVIVALFPAAPVLAATPRSADAKSDGATSYRPPVDAAVIDGFRPPPAPWGSGNRGLEYATTAGQPVAASADGQVVFAGSVAGSLHVVVLHSDGVRTSYSFLGDISVVRGQRVRQGEQLGHAAQRFHFGARAGDAYLDPAGLFDPGPPAVHLVPDDQRRPGTIAQERAALARLVDAVGRGARLAADLGGNALVAAEGIAGPLSAGYEGIRAGVDWWRERDHCTPPGVVPPPPAQRHIAVLVGGLGSSSDKAAIDDVDTAALGFAPTDVVRFSYRGGTTAENPYTPSDSGADMAVSARRLRELIQRIGAQNPGVPIDLLAHSQGGVVARAAISEEFDGLDPRLPPLGALVTLASPHQGADLGTAAAVLNPTPLGRGLDAGVYLGSKGGLNPRWEAVTQLAVSSPFMRRLNQRPLPAGLPVTSIGSRGDLVVAAGRTRLDGAERVTVAVSGVLNDHGRLPGSPVAQREIALGLAGLPPTCQGMFDAVSGAVVPAAISFSEKAATVALLGLSVAESPVP